MADREPNVAGRVSETGTGRSGDGNSTWPLIALLLLAAATLVSLQWRRPKPEDPLVGKPLPPLDAAGWLNADGPLAADDLRGKIVVIDFWASWCGPCAKGLPDLAKFYHRFRDQDLALVGLTSEPAADLERIEQFNRRVDGVDWPIAYGAVMAGDVMGIEGVPTYVLFDRTGVSIWSGWNVDDLEAAVVELLAKGE